MAKKTPIEESTKPTGPALSDASNAELREILVELASFVRKTAAVLGSTPTARSKHAGECFDVIDLITRARHLLDEI